MKMKIVSLFFEGIVALGTLFLAILAIWGPQIQAKLMPPKLSIVPHQLLGTLNCLQNGGKKVFYYLLKVTNARPKLTARNCRVLLTGISKRMPNDQFQPVTFDVPSQFRWSPAEAMPLWPLPTSLDVQKDQVFDLGRVVEGENMFTPALYWYPFDFQGCVKPNEAFQYTLEISADGYSAKRCQIFQVSWDGQWNDNPDIMGQHLCVKEVKGSGGK